MQLANIALTSHSHIRNHGSLFKKVMDTRFIPTRAGRSPSPGVSKCKPILLVPISARRLPCCFPCYALDASSPLFPLFRRHNPPSCNLLPTTTTYLVQSSPHIVNVPSPIISGPIPASWDPPPGPPPPHPPYPPKQPQPLGGGDPWNALALINPPAQQHQQAHASPSNLTVNVFFTPHQQPTQLPTDVMGPPLPLPPTPTPPPRCVPLRRSLQH